MDPKWYNDVSALATATACSHWKSVKILNENGADLNSAFDDGDAPLLD